MYVLLYILIIIIKAAERNIRLGTENDVFKQNAKKLPIKLLYNDSLINTNIECIPKPNHNYHDLKYGNYNFNQYDTIYACKINSSKHIDANDCQILISKCSFKSLSTSCNGGAIYLYFSDENNITEKNTIIEKCKFNQCSARFGGAIFISSLNSSFIINIIESTFQDNQAKSGGGIYCKSINGEISYCKFINNVCTNKDGSDITFDFSISEVKSNESLNIHNNHFEHHIQQDFTNSIIYFINKRSVYFIFSENTFNFTQIDSNFHIFDSFHSNTQLKGVWVFQFNRIISPYSKNNEKILKGTNFSDNLDINFFGSKVPIEYADYIVFNDNKKRCKYSSNEGKIMRVLVLNTNFTAYEQRGEDGGAIHIINCGLACNNSNFKCCSSLIGGGGAIYFHNFFGGYANHLILSKLHFKECKAIYGGALYAFSVSKSSIISIDLCSFKSNDLIQRNSNSIYQLHGGSSIFLTIRNGFILDCSFKFNKGDDASFKIYGNFERNPNEIKFVYPDGENDKNDSNKILVKNCSFKNEEKSKNSIYFINKKQGSKVELINCSFSGILDENECYINGLLIDKMHLKLM